MRAEELPVLLEQGLEEPKAVFDLLLGELQQGHEQQDLWRALNGAAQRTGQGPELLQLYAETLASGALHDAAQRLCVTLARANALAQLGQGGDAVEQLEALLDGEIDAAVARRVRSQLVEVLMQIPQRREVAVEQAERVLAEDPSDPLARSALESALAVGALASRAAGLLAQANDRLQNYEVAAVLYERALAGARGEVRHRWQSRLAVLKQDELGDPAGALELLRPVVAHDPGDDAARGRLVALSEQFGDPLGAAHLLLQSFVASTEPLLRAQLGVELGQLFRRSGDGARAAAVLQQVVDLGLEEHSILVAARDLCELYADAGQLEALARVLDWAVQLETDAARKVEYARRLARLAEGECPDAQRAITAWCALAESPWREEALRRLAVLGTTPAEHDQIADWLTRVASTETDEARARSLLADAARRRAQGEDRRAAVLAWQRWAERFEMDDEAREAIERLLVSDRRWKDLARHYETEAERSGEPRRLDPLQRAAELHAWVLNDPASAVPRYAAILDEAPERSAAERSLERLLAAPHGAVPAATYLEQHYLRQGNPLGRARVLELLAGTAEDPAQRLAYFAEASRVATDELAHPRRALTLAGRGLREAARAQQDALPEWLDRCAALAVEVADYAAFAELLSRALAQCTSVNTPGAAQLALQAGQALARIGAIEPAVDALKLAKAVGGAPGAEEWLEAALAEPQDPVERAASVTAALAAATEPGEIRELHHALAWIQARDLGDDDAALATWRAAVQADPEDWAAHRALVQAYMQAQQFSGVRDELQRVLPQMHGERSLLVRLQLADTLAQLNEPEAALKEYRSVISQERSLPQEVWSAAERIAGELSDDDTLGELLDKRLELEVEPWQRAALLERQGERFSRLGDSEVALEKWLQAAELYAGLGDDASSAERRLAKLLELAPQRSDIARLLLDVRVRRGAWKRLHEPLAVVLDADGGPAIGAAWLTEVASAAQRSRALDSYLELLQQVTAVTEGSDAQRALKLVAARALGPQAKGGEEAARLYRELLEEGPYRAAIERDFEALLRAATDQPEIRASWRWLWKYRVEHGGQPAAALFAWAEAEEQRFGDHEAAVALFRAAADKDPERTDAWVELARLQLELGHPERANEALRQLRDKLTGELHYELTLHIARLTMERLEQPLQALEVLEPVVGRAPIDPEVLRIVHWGLTKDTSRAKAAAMLERATSAVDDPAARAEALRVLLEVSAGSSEFQHDRVRWYVRYLECLTNDPQSGLDVALRAATELPDQESLWEQAEGFARRLESPGPVAEAYERALQHDIPSTTAEILGRRLVDFHEEWFREPERVVSLLETIVELAPGASWAFDRLKLEFNAAGRWHDLFRLYDRAIERAEQEAGRIELLREVAMAAKDFAAEPDRAIGYFVRLHELVPDDFRIESALERLYDRGGHARPLIDLLTARVPRVDVETARGLELRIAALWLDIDDAIGSLTIVERLLEPSERVGEVAPLLERLVNLPTARESEVEVSTARGRRSKRTKTVTVRERAAEHLRRHYESIGQISDVVRMLEVLVDVAGNDDQRAKRLEHTVRVRLDELNDDSGAFENMLLLVALAPSADKHRTLLHKLATRVGEHERQCELLTRLADASDDPRLQVGLLSESACVTHKDIGDKGRAIELYMRVLAMSEHNQALSLAAARELDALLDEAQRSEERCSVLERRAALEDDLALRRRALGEAARVAFARLGDAPRAVANWRLRLTDDANDLEALDGLVEALGESRQWRDLVDALRQRAALAEDDRARADRVRMAVVLAEQLAMTTEAISTWRSVRELHGRDDESFEALRGLLNTEQRWAELSALLEDEATATPAGARRAELLGELGELHHARTKDTSAAVEAFVGADDWQRAVEVVATAHTDRELGQRVCRGLLKLAVAAWEEPGAPSSGPEMAAAWAVDELAARLSEDAQHDAVVELLVQAAAFPFAEEKRRDLRRRAACLCHDRLQDLNRAAALFEELFEQDAGDSVALSSVTRFASILEGLGRHGDVAGLWENQARSRAERGEGAAAAALWARAAGLWESRFGDIERAVAAYREGAALNGEACLEALARLHEQAGEHEQAAAALERLLAQSAREVAADWALRLADAYVAARCPDKARVALASVMDHALDPRRIQTRLAQLCREAEDWDELARLLEVQARTTAVATERLRLLGEAAAVHVERRGAPEAAVALLSQAVTIAPEDATLRLALADALVRAGRNDEAVTALRKQLAQYGSRRPKERALVHLALAQALLAQSDSGPATEELELANRIDPAHPMILRALGRVAFQAGEFDRAAQTYRALLLVLPPATERGRPSRAEALLELAQIAEQQRDTTRASEFEESAFEVAQETAQEAEALEKALRERGKPELLMRAIEGRLRDSRDPARTVRALADLAELHVGAPAGIAPVAERLRSQAEALYPELQAAASNDEGAWSAIGRVYEALGDSGAEARVLEQQVEALLERGAQGPKDSGPFYRLAEVLLRSEESRERGLTLLERAIELKSEPARAAATLSAAVDAGLVNERSLTLLEAVSRQAGDQPRLAGALARIVRLAGNRGDALREGAQLAADLGDTALHMRILRAVVEPTDVLWNDADAAWARVRLATLLQAEGELLEAMQLQREAAEFLPPEEQRSVLLSVARSATDQLDQPTRAVSIYEELLEKEPADREAWEPLLALYRNLGDSEALVGLIDQTAPMVDLASDRSRLRFEQAGLLLEQKKVERAIELLQENLADDPLATDSAELLAKTLESEGRVDELVALLNGRLDSAKDHQELPSIAELSKRLGRLLEAEQRPDDALSIYRSWIDWDRDAVDALRAVLRLSKLGGDPYTIAEALEDLLRIETGDEALALTAELASLRESQADEPGIERALRLGFAAVPTSEELRERLLARLEERREWSEMAEILQRASEAALGDLELGRRLISVLERAGDSEQALEVVERLLEVAATDVALLRQRARLLEQVNRWELVVEALEQVYQHDSGAAGDLLAAIERALDGASPEARVRLLRRLAELRAAQQDIAGAIEVLEELASEYPDDKDCVGQLARLSVATGDHARAVRALGRLAEHQDGDALAATAQELAAAAEQSGLWQEAQSGLERAAAALPQLPSVGLALRKAYQHLGANEPLAQLVLDDAEVTEDAGEKVKLLLEASRLLLDSDAQIDRARDVLEQAAQLEPDNTDITVMLARLLDRSGDSEQAMQRLNAMVAAHRGRRVKSLAPAYEEMAAIQMREGLLSDAVASMSRAFDMDLRNARIAMRLGQMALQAKDRDAAMRAFRAVSMMRNADQSPEAATGEDKAEAYFYLATMAREDGDLRKAKILVSKALTENAEHGRARQLAEELT